MSEIKKQTDEGAVKERLKKWKASVEHLNMQLHLGESEAKEEFETFKNGLRKWLDTVGKKIEATSGIAADKAQDLKNALQELRLQTSLAKAGTEDALHDQQEKVSKALHQLKHSIETAYGSGKNKLTNFSDDVSDSLSDFHMRLDLFRLHLILKKMDTGETWEKKKKEISGKLHQLKKKMESDKDITSEKWNHFSGEITEAWEHIAKAFKVGK